MHRIEIINPERPPEPDVARTFSSSWRQLQFGRANASARNLWFDVFEDEEFGSSIVMVGDVARMRTHLRRREDLPEAAEQQGLALVYPNWAVTEARLRSFALDFGCSPAVVRTFVALFQTCDVRLAARRTGLSCETAREQLDTARAVVGAGNLPRLVTLMGLGIGRTGEDGEEYDEFLAAAYDVSERQVRIAGMIAEGATRRAVSEACGISEAVVKKELAHIFAIIGVSNAIALARRMVELRLLATTTNRPVGRRFGSEPAVQLLSVTARDGRRIVANDYGPSEGRPVLVLHSSMTNRPINSSLVYALQAAGYRPVAVDRPGFGETADAPSNCTGQSFFDLSAQDMVDFCDAMRWRCVPLVSRGAAQIVLALHRIRPEMIACAVIMNPDPDARSSSKQTGFLATMKTHFARRPWAVEMMSRWVVNSMTFERVSDHVRRSALGCDADMHTMTVPRHMADYYRALIDFRRGRVDGFIKEQVALATVGKPAPVGGTPHFSLLIGERDSLHDPAETLRYWRDVLPEADTSIATGTGRFMSYSHPDVAVNALAKALSREGNQSRGAIE